MASGIAGILVTVLLALLGLVMIAFPKKMIAFQVWVAKTVMGAQYIPSRKTERMMRLVGIFVLLIAVLVAYRLMSLPQAA